MVEKNLKFWIEKDCETCKTRFWTLIKRNGRFCSNVCSSKSTANDPDRIYKIKKTKLDRYGSETYVNSDKARQTCLNKYGTDNASKSDDIISKIKATNNNKWGVEWAWQNENIKKKIRLSTLNKYGVDNVSKSDNIKEKKRELSLDKYGVDNVSKSNIVINKIKDTNISRFGNVCPLKNKEVLDKCNISRRRVYYNKIKSRLEHRVELLFTENDYISTDKKHTYNFKCKLCNCNFIDHMDGGRIPRCMVCYPYLNGVSKGEIDILNYIINSLPGTEIKTKCRDIIKNREIDIYIPSLKIGIEYNGLYWHSEIGGKKDKQYHLSKYNICKSKDIRLIQIFEDEWVNNTDIVKHRLKSILGLNVSIYARKCEVKDISYADSNLFISKYHIQGNVPSRYNIGLYYNDVLVSVMTFGYLRTINGKHDKNNDYYELLRMASSNNVVGGASKMFSYFIKKYSPRYIMSYSDLRWNTGNVYEKIGMVATKDTPPNYWYFNPGYCQRYHRFSFRKSILNAKLSTVDMELTEWENMQLNGYDRIWDCGNRKYEWHMKAD